MRSRGWMKGQPSPFSLRVGKQKRREATRLVKAGVDNCCDTERRVARSKKCTAAYQPVGSM